MFLKLLLALLFLATAVAAQPPLDNPFNTKYNINDHWTQKLKWKSVTNADQIVGLVDKDGKVDSTILASTMNNISKLGGGIIYFPPGNYFFNFNLVMQNGVILRGGSPKGSLQAVDANYTLPTKFNFPKYDPLGKGANTAGVLKRVNCGDTSKVNFGIVNIDVNRAIIDFYRSGNDNVIVFGLRSNNAVSFHATSDRWVDKIKQGWQKYPNLNEANISIKSDNNAVIANCRINDSITDDFEMPNFQTNDGYIFKENIKFQYAFHPGIALRWPEKEGLDLQISDNFVRCGGPTKIDVTTINAVKIQNNLLEDVPVQDLIDVNGGYSKVMQKKVADVFEHMVFVNRGDTLNYELLKPANYDKNKKYPLVVFYPAIEDFQNPLSHFVQTFISKQSGPQKYFVLVSNPVKKVNGEYKLPYNIPATILLLNNIKQDYSIDPGRISVAGVSTGGGSAWTSLFNYPNTFTNAIIMSYVKRLTKDELNTVKNVKFIISQGTDDNFIPIAYSRFEVESLKKNGSQVKYYEYTGFGHFSWLGLCSDPRFLEAMFNSSAN